MRDPVRPRGAGWLGVPLAVVVLGVTGGERPPGVAPTAAPTAGSHVPAADVRPSETSRRFPATGPASDTVRILERVRSRQRDFERVRRRHLPPGSAPSRRCDAVVGRYCFWHEEDEDWEPPPEPPEVSREREALIDELLEAAEALPRSPWIAGQLVRYLTEAERHDEALAAAARCRASTTWCGVLSGYALHAAERWAAADSAFSRALARMPPAERCAWNDLSFLLDGAARERYEALSCGERDAFEERFWSLADPLYLVPGNDRRTEHLSRGVLDRLQEDAASPSGGTWGEDRRELLVRFGWPIAWERDISRSARSPGFGSDVIARHAPRSWRFAPPARALLRPETLEREDWKLDARRRRSTYAPPYASSFAPLEHRISVFRRGDSARVVATYRMDPDRGGDSEEAEALLAIVHAHETRAPRRDRARGRAGVLDVIAPAGSWWIAVEAFSRPFGRAERARYARNPDPGESDALSISDLLLLSLSPADSVPERLESAIPRARPPAPARPGERLGLYWEIYGLPDAPGLPALPRAVSLTVTLEKRDRGWLRGLAEGLGLLGGSDPYVRVRWRDRLASSAAVHPRSVAVTLPRELQAGRYRLEVTARFAGREPLIAARDLEVDRP